ncbi:MAG TPA: hypothetical protein EYN41_04775 [Flavobacteriales bacterium]|jgi:hypothetical protein|nr:hypothetical protein [Flavobacteriales bacterium]
MHTIEPHYNWRNLYIASEDERSPFFGKAYSEFEFTQVIYDHVIHPQWDYFGTPSLYLKVLFADYDEGFAVIELLGEWNDCINNDIMFLKREVVEPLMKNCVNKFILVGENVLNFHASDECYYEEWSEELDDGWIYMLNFREHVLNEFCQNSIDKYFTNLETNYEMHWRTFRPMQLFQKIELSISESDRTGILEIES